MKLSKLYIQLLFLMLWSLSSQVFGVDYSTPKDGNLYIESSTKFVPKKTSIYSDKSILERKNMDLEDAIFLAAKKYVGYVEASTNARVFPEIYEVPLREIKNELTSLSNELESLKELSV